MNGKGHKTTIPRSAFILLMFFLVVFLAITQKVSDSKPLRNFIGFSKLEWTSVKGCRLLKNDSQGFASLERVVTWVKGRPHTAVCKSDWFVPKSRYLELEYAAYKPVDSEHELHFLLEFQERRTSSGPKSTSLAPIELSPAAGVRNGTWRLLAHILEDNQLETPVRIALVDKDPQAGWLSLRSKVNFYQVSNWSLSLRTLGQKHSRMLHWGLVVSLSILFMLILSYITNSIRIFLLCLFIAFLFHYRFDLFFYADDFDFFSRYNLYGWPGILYNHHEHIIPIFSAVFFSEYLLFGSNYQAFLILSMVLAALNATLLCSLLRKLQISREAAVIAGGILFTASYLQGAALQWVTCQSILLSVFFRLLAFNVALKSGSDYCALWLSVLFFSILGSALSFGGGITVWLEVVILIVLFGKKGSKANCKLMLTAVTAGVVVASMYFYNSYVVEHTQNRLSLANPIEIIRYVFFGAQYGTFARGLGFSQFLTFGNWFSGVDKDIVLSLSALAPGLILLSLYCFVFRDKWRFWILGQLLMMLPFLLTGIGRYRWGGVDYALSLRYYPIPTIGLCVLVAPILQELGKRKLIFSIILLLFLEHQIHRISSERFYIDKGLLSKSFAQQLVNWRSIQEQSKNSTEYDGRGTDFSGLYPIPYAGSPHDPVAYVPKKHPEYLMNLLRGDVR